MFSIIRRFDDDIKFIEKHKDIALRQVALWDAKFQELSKVFNIPIGDMKLHAVSREPSLFSREFFFNDYSLYISNYKYRSISVDCKIA